MRHYVHEPLYDVGTAPETVAAGEDVLLWANVRSDWPLAGAPTTAAWATPPYGEQMALTQSGVISGGLLWRWDEVWAVPGSALSKERSRAPKS